MLIQISHQDILLHEKSRLWLVWPVSYETGLKRQTYKFMQNRISLERSTRSWYRLWRGLTVIQRKEKVYFLLHNYLYCSIFYHVHKLLRSILTLINNNRCAIYVCGSEQWLEHMGHTNLEALDLETDKKIFNLVLSPTSRAGFV